MRPKLNRDIDVKDFLDFYWLKSELVDFCKENILPYTGSKKDMTETIKYFLETGEVLKVKKKKESCSSSNFEISLNSKIPLNSKTDQKHRLFFKSVIGNFFKFNVTFMDWMKKNSGKTYEEAVKEWHKIDKEKKQGIKRDISPQFEYNQYTRDFFNDNPNLTREDCIKCWKYKKSLAGNNKYETDDLNCLEYFTNHATIQN